MADSPWLSRGFLIAGSVNIVGGLLFSKGLTNAYLSGLQPQVLSTFGFIGIMLWGLAYLAMAGSYRGARWMVAVFVVEKLVYVAAWLSWISAHGSELSTIFETSALTGTFFVIYGPTDFFFGVFFAWVFYKTRDAAD